MNKSSLSQQRKELKDWYVRKLLRAFGWPNNGINDNPGLIELYKVMVKTKRAIRERGLTN